MISPVVSHPASPPLPQAKSEARSSLPLIFISWSGDEERNIALAIQEYLEASGRVKTFVSARDIHSSHTGWFDAIKDAIKKAQYGIICMTERNSTAPWLMYESGALELQLDFRNVSVLLLGMLKNKLPSPLRHKQARQFSKKDFEAMTAEIHSALHLPPPVTDKKAWDALQRKVRAQIRLIKRKAEAPKAEFIQAQTEPASESVPELPEKSPIPSNNNQTPPLALNMTPITDALQLNVYMRVISPSGLFFDGNQLKEGDFFYAPNVRAQNILAAGTAEKVSADHPICVGIHNDFNIGFDRYCAHTVAIIPLRHALRQRAARNVDLLPRDWVCFCEHPPAGKFGYANYRFMPRSEAEQLEHQGLGHINH